MCDKFKYLKVDVFIVNVLGSQIFLIFIIGHAKK